MYMYHNHINYYHETNKIAVTGKKSRVGKPNTTCEGFIFHRDAKATNVPYFLAQNVPNEKVVCSHMLLKVLGSAIAICGALYAAYQCFQIIILVSWIQKQQMLYIVLFPVL